MQAFKKDHNISLSQAIALSCDITTLDNEQLTNMATDEEITQVVHQISPLKALEPDDMHAIFYRKYWYILRKSVCGMIRAFLEHGHILHHINSLQNYKLIDCV